MFAIMYHSMVFAGVAIPTKTVPSVTDSIDLTEEKSIGSKNWGKEI